MTRCLAPDCQMGGLGCDNMTVILVCFLHDGDNYDKLAEKCKTIASNNNNNPNYTNRYTISNLNNINNNTNSFDIISNNINRSNNETTTLQIDDKK